MVNSCSATAGSLSGVTYSQSGDGHGMVVGAMMWGVVLNLGSHLRYVVGVSVVGTIMPYSWCSPR